MLRIILPHVNSSRVASPGREHCHSPVKGCWLARTHRHSRHSSSFSRPSFVLRICKNGGNLHPLTFYLGMSNGERLNWVSPVIFPKGKIVRLKHGVSSAGIPEPGTGQSA